MAISCLVNSLTALQLQSPPHNLFEHEGNACVTVAGRTTRGEQCEKPSGHLHQVHAPGLGPVEVHLLHCRTEALQMTSRFVGRLRLHLVSRSCSPPQAVRVEVWSACAGPASSPDRAPGVQRSDGIEVSILLSAACCITSSTLLQMCLAVQDTLRQCPAFAATARRNSYIAM